MAGKLRALVATEGPLLSDSAWMDNGEAVAFAAFTSTSTATELYVGIVPAPTVGADNVPSGQAILRLLGGYVVENTALTAQTTLTLGLAVYRANVLVGGTIAFGWLIAGTGTPALAARTAVSMPAIAANTALVAAAAGEPAFLPLQPGDIVMLRSLSSGSVAVNAGAISYFAN